MSMMESFMPHPERDETIAAADPGNGAPAPAPGFGIEGEDPDRAQSQEQDQEEAQAGPVADAPDDDVPFRTPDPRDVHRP